MDTKNVFKGKKIYYWILGAIVVIVAVFMALRFNTAAASNVNTEITGSVVSMTMSTTVDATEKHINLALKASYLLGGLVDDLRLLTLAESGQLSFDIRETNLAALAEQVCEMFVAEAAEKSIALRLEPATRDFLVLADHQRTEQVVGNLVGNALRYIPEGAEIRLSLAQEGDQASLSIEDSGPGIPEEDLPYIFERFWRKDKSRARSSGGSGLGLTIARQLIESQGGRIRAENRPGGGLKMVIFLPFARIAK